MLRDAIGKNGKKQFEGYGDLSLTELLPALLFRYGQTEMVIAAPSLPDQAADAVAAMMRKQFALMSGPGKKDVVKRMTVIADLSQEESPAASSWLRENPFEGRLTLVDSRQQDTVLLLPDFAITGPVNMRYGRHFVATATAVKEEVDALWARYRIQEKPAEDEKPEPRRLSRRERRSVADDERPEV